MFARNVAAAAAAMRDTHQSVTMARGSRHPVMWCGRTHAKRTARLMPQQGVALSAKPICNASWHSFWWVLKSTCTSLRRTVSVKQSAMLCTGITGQHTVSTVQMLCSVKAIRAISTGGWRSRHAPTARQPRLPAAASSHTVRKLASSNSRRRRRESSGAAVRLLSAGDTSGCKGAYRGGICFGHLSLRRLCTVDEWLGLLHLSAPQLKMCTHQLITHGHVWTNALQTDTG